MKKYITMLILLAFTTIVCAQKNEIYDPNISTLQVVAGDRWLSMPVIRLNQDEVINIGFDDQDKIHSQ